MMSAGVTGELTAVPPAPALRGSLLPADDPVAGHLFPQGRVARDGAPVRFDDAHGVGLRLVTISEEPLDLEPALAGWFADERGRVVALGVDDDVDGTYATWFVAHGTRWALQRPDFHVHGTAADPVGAAALIADLRRRLTDPQERR